MPKGRRSRNVEFLQKLYEFSGSSSIAEFARKCGKQPANMNQYLNNKRMPGDKVLTDCMQGIFGWGIDPILEIEEIPERQTDIEQSSGVYVLHDSAGNVLYIGRATNFRQEVWQTLGRSIPIGMRFGPDLGTNQYPTLWDVATYYSLYEISDSTLRHNVEALLLRVFINQTHNRKIGKFRSRN